MFAHITSILHDNITIVILVIRILLFISLSTLIQHYINNHITRPVTMNIDMISPNIADNNITITNTSIDDIIVSLIVICDKDIRINSTIILLQSIPYLLYLP